MVTEELFTCQARGLALNTRLVSLGLAEEDGYLLTRLVPQRSHPQPREELFRGERENSGVLALDLCRILPFAPAPSSPGGPNLGWHPWDMPQPVGRAGSASWSHLSVLRGGRTLFCRRWASELSIFTLSGSDSGVSVAPAGVILGKEPSWRGQGGPSEDLVLAQISAHGGKGTQGDQGHNVGWGPQKAVGLCSGSQRISCDC